MVRHRATWTVVWLVGFGVAVLGTVSTQAGLLPLSPILRLAAGVMVVLAGVAIMSRSLARLGV